ncbi:hypothetical protein COLO4_32734 [Corchorus olitorius]|uniref:Uncharacterized protein n=1 Tax=Corchorus olitorius TaxID=93759 RepID=A0A1R3GY87_9ROSI|nr:hypothetical protein COLO4_32734 [Corchorus olitorius]
MLSFLAIPRKLGPSVASMALPFRSDLVPVSDD